jgi:hypothetical protein
LYAAAKAKLTRKQTFNVDEVARLAEIRRSSDEAKPNHKGCHSFVVGRHDFRLFFV